MFLNAGDSIGPSNPSSDIQLVNKLKSLSEFELLKRKSCSLAIWYNGLIESISHVDRVISHLGS